MNYFAEWNLWISPTFAKKVANVLGPIPGMELRLKPGGTERSLGFTGVDRDFSSRN